MTSVDAKKIINATSIVKRSISRGSGNNKGLVR